MKLTQQQVQHLLGRAGFGDNYRKIHSYIGQTPDQILKKEIELTKKSKSVRINSDFQMNWEMMMEMSPAEKAEMQKKGRQEVIHLNSLWIQEMASAPSGLLEKMSFFWHDHFACQPRNPVHAEQYLKVIRENALGNFGELLRGVSKSPAMLNYLNNQQNRKQAPNENFAREVMELFTLGQDQGYTEKDISEAARAFTGWGFKNNEFFDREFFHDKGFKTILGQTGNFNGDDVIDLLLKNRRTAEYISEKWVRYFVTYEGNKELEEEVAISLYESNYNISAALKTLFSSSTFYQEKYFGGRIKSPIELIVGMQRQLRFRIEDQDSLIFLQRTMGQTLFDPPNVAGWPDGKDWVDSASLLFRIKIPELVFKQAVIQSKVDSYDDNDQFKIKGKLSKLEVNIDFKSLQSDLDRLSTRELRDFLLPVEIAVPDSSPSLKESIVFLTSKPEYQLC